MLCHTENIAPGTVAIARSGNDVPASDVANPEFYIPISTDKAFVFCKPLISASLENKQKPNQLAYYMKNGMACHRIDNTVLTVKPSEQHTKNTVKQKAANNNQWRQLTEDTDS